MNSVYGTRVCVTSRGGFLFFFCLFDFYSSINVDLGYSFYILAALCDVCDRKCYSTMNYILWF